MTQELEEKKTKELTALHAEWLHHPITVHARELLSQHRDGVVQTLEKASFDEKDIQVRSLANQLRTISAFQNLLFNTEKFVEQSTVNK